MTEYRAKENFKFKRWWCGGSVKIEGNIKFGAMANVKCNIMWKLWWTILPPTTFSTSNTAAASMPIYSNVSHFSPRITILSHYESRFEKYFPSTLWNCILYIHINATFNLYMMIVVYQFCYQNVNEEFSSSQKPPFFKNSRRELERRKKFKSNKLKNNLNKNFPYHVIF